MPLQNLLRIILKRAAVHFLPFVLSTSGVNLLLILVLVFSLVFILLVSFIVSSYMLFFFGVSNTLCNRIWLKGLTRSTKDMWAGLQYSIVDVLKVWRLICGRKLSIANEVILLLVVCRICLTT